MTEQDASSSILDQQLEQDVMALIQRHTWCRILQEMLRQANLVGEDWKHIAANLEGAFIESCMYFCRKQALKRRAK